MIYFDSDYMAGAHPEVMARLLETNFEQTTGYGTDPYTEKAVKLIKEACVAPDARVHFLVGGTQTNATVIDGVLARHEGVLAAESGHINVHESGAVEATGHKVLTLPSYQGKVSARDVRRFITEFYLGFKSSRSKANRGFNRGLYRSLESEWISGIFI